MRKLPGAGNAAAAMTLGRLYVRGEHIDKDNDATAIAWYEKAAALGDAKGHAPARRHISPRGKLVAKGPEPGCFLVPESRQSRRRIGTACICLMLRDGKGIEPNNGKR